MSFAFLFHYSLYRIFSALTVQNYVAATFVVKMFEFLVILGILLLYLAVTLPNII